MLKIPIMSFKSVVSVIFAAVCIFSCRGGLPDDSAALLSPAIRFGATTVENRGSASRIVFGADPTCCESWEPLAYTRTEYSGKDEEGNDIGSSSNRERINWVSSDSIRILSPQALVQNNGNFQQSASSSHSVADYAVVPGSTENERHNATLAPVAGNGLQWGDGAHDFYAMYPVPAGSSQDALTYEQATGKVTLRGRIPATQTVTLKGGRLYVPDMRTAYMAARSTGVANKSDVHLTFCPMFTAYEISVMAADGAMAAKRLLSATLSSRPVGEGGAYLSGCFTTDLTDAGMAVTPLDDAATSVTVNFGENGIFLHREEVTTFTLFTLPIAQTKLTLSLLFEGNVTRKLDLKYNNAWIEVSPKEKLFIHDLAVNGGAWTYHFDDLAGDKAATRFGAEVTLSYSPFRSYRSIGSYSEAVPFTVEWSQDEGASWSTATPAWLISAPEGGLHDGSTGGELLRIQIAPQVNSAVDSSHKTLSVRAPRGSLAEPFDLSKVSPAIPAANPGGWDHPSDTRTTANSYVVQAPGTYKIPLVYGNGIVNSLPNEDAWRARKGYGGNYRPDEGDPTPGISALGRFKDHLDNYIISPYIAVQHSGKTLTAKLIWTDAKGLVTPDAAIIGTGEEACIRFSVPDSTITNGNALIAVLADDIIAWSWHIWITDEDLSDVKAGSNGYMLAPVNLGWCRKKMTEKYEERTLRFRVSQSGSGITREITVSQKSDSLVVRGNQPYYTWGLKDPVQAMIPNDVPINGRYNEALTQVKPYYSASGENLATYICEYSQQITPGYTIQNPYRGNFYDFGTDMQTFSQNSAYTIFLNNWNTSLDSWGEYDYYSESMGGGPGTKTVYDPCPVGFKVPPPTAFSTITPERLSVETYRGDFVARLAGSDLVFPYSGQFRGRQKPISNTGSCHTSFPRAEKYSGRFRGYTLFYNLALSAAYIHGEQLSDAIPVRPVAEKSNLGATASGQKVNNVDVGSSWQ